MAKSKKIELNAELKGKFKVVGSPVSSRFSDPVFGVIDFRTMSIKHAEILAASPKFKYLEAVAQKPATKGK
ncbi:hypothetical protein GBO34_00765 [Roseivirga pacifica]|uniref:hypothetical protein n=1 Tax=Roseivirga pacifica TaxID=1267423 RepID=UPI002094F5F5|nr:hypothetical protein [Roseivirga pacifica]MCO6367844.1 hypothetical protein [Roseivirga pacifica]MCO6377216.1 hypothetical protein [Roseivirga pacifica]